jgi:hypothetical protein
LKLIFLILKGGERTSVQLPINSLWLYWGKKNGDDTSVQLLSKH